MTRSVVRVGNFASPLSSFSLSLSFSLSSFSLSPGLLPPRPCWFPAPFSGCGAPFFLSSPPPFSLPFPLVLPDPAPYAPLVVFSPSVFFVSFSLSLFLSFCVVCASSSPVGIVVWLLSLSRRFSWCWGLCLSQFPLLLLRAALGYAPGFASLIPWILCFLLWTRSAAWFNTSVYLCPLLNLQPCSTYVPCATYVVGACDLYS